MIYCWSILNSLPKKESKNNTTLDHGYDKENAFAILEVDGDNAEQDEDIFPMRPIQRPKPLDTPIAIEEILDDSVELNCAPAEDVQDAEPISFAILSLRFTQQLTMRLTDLHHTTTRKERWRMRLLIVRLKPRRRHQM